MGDGEDGKGVVPSNDSEDKKASIENLRTSTAFDKDKNKQTLSLSNPRIKKKTLGK